MFFLGGGRLFLRVLQRPVTLILLKNNCDRNGRCNCDTSLGVDTYITSNQQEGILVQN